MLTRYNKRKQPFCLNNFGGPLPALAFEKPCVIAIREQQWDLTSKVPLIGWQLTNYCWDTLGATEKYTRITLETCNPETKSQQFRKKLVTKR
jgi:hypothetical protein